MICERRTGSALGRIVPGLTASLVLCAADTAAAETYRLNNVDRAARIHMREAPNNGGRVVTYLIPDNKRLEGTGNCNPRWCEVTFGDVTGWVFPKCLAVVPGSETPAPTATHPPADMPYAASPRSDSADKDLPAPLHDKLLRPYHTAGRDVPVYAFPNDRLPAAGRISSEIAEVEDLGTCARKFCYVRSGSLVGWIPDGAVLKGDGAAPPPQAQSSMKSGKTLISRRPQANPRVRSRRRRA